MRTLIVSTFLTLDGVMRTAALEQDAGPELQVHGSGNLIQTLLRANLVDRKVSSTGVVTGTYEPAGEVVTGTFAWD